MIAGQKAIGEWIDRSTHVSTIAASAPYTWTEARPWGRTQAALLERAVQTPFGIWLPQVTVLRCQQFEQASDAVEAVRERQCVVLQLEGMEPSESQRILDFVAGAVHALDGHMERVGDGTYLCAPAGVGVSQLSGSSGSSVEPA